MLNSSLFDENIVVCIEYNHRQRVFSPVHGKDVVYGIKERDHF